METHLSWDKFSSQNYTADFDLTYLRQHCSYDTIFATCWKAANCSLGTHSSLKALQQVCVDLPYGISHTLNAYAGAPGNRREGALSKPGVNEF